MLIVFIGPPGAGKGTQAAHLTRHLGIAHLSTGEVLREAKSQGTRLGLLAADYMNRGDLVPDDIMVNLVTERLAQTDNVGGCLLDGFPRTLAQAEAFDRLLREHGRTLDIVVELACDDAELTRRLLERAKKEGRADDTPDTIARRQATYRAQTAPLLDYYKAQGVLLSVDGMQEPHRVFEDVRKVVEEHVPQK